ncbi:sensor histidine kinase [Clostridium guangxiense]|uniref:sensor histidine kinase n=1 Tax=Clostridium guangxiense TaxID=1662055 RepID=UPI001E5AD954|nr:sensor histidine kinase [Clostridium guangxiense]MCD2347058.1 sensor histidine kinase [Clostridium guangxiense]
MESNRNLKYINLFMIFINFTIVIFISKIMTITLYKISSEFMARDFFDQITVIPWKPQNITIVSIGSYIILISLVTVKKKCVNSLKKWKIAVLLLCEIFLSIVIMTALNMSYNGIMLFIIADLVTNTKDKSNKIIFLVLMIIIYILSVYDFISLKIKMVSFQSFLFYYNANMRSYLMEIKSILNSINIIVFILYMIVLIQVQMRENEKIISLNKRLNLANEKLEVMNVQLKQYAVKIESMAETRERNRLAREIHDTLGHALTGISVGIDACLTTIDMSTEATKKQLNVIADVARQAIKDVRRSVKKLRPDALESSGLEDALNNMILQISKVTKTKVFFNTNVKLLKFGHDEEDTIYRIIQEGITNAIRHGQATEIYISMKRRDKQLNITIRDNGRGCANIKEGFGLRHIEERVKLLNGTVEYNGSDSFWITVNIPIRWGDESD